MHLLQQALRRLIRGVRKRLKRSGKYDDTLLAALDLYKVKLTELSTNAIVVRPHPQKIDRDGGPIPTHLKKKRKVAQKESK